MWSSGYWAIFRTEGPRISAWLMESCLLSLGKDFTVLHLCIHFCSFVPLSHLNCNLFQLGHMHQHLCGGGTMPTTEGCQFKQE